MAKNQEEFKIKIEEKHKANYERFVMTVAERIALGDDIEGISKNAAHFSFLLGKKWSKEEIIAAASIKAKQYSTSEILFIKRKRS